MCVGSKWFNCERLCVLAVSGSTVRGCVCVGSKWFNCERLCVLAVSGSTVRGCVCWQ